MERTFNKLVRDKIPEIIKTNGEEAVVRKLSDDEYKVELYKKLLEEANEVLGSQNAESTLEELADVLEILKSIAELNKKKIDDVIAIADQKRLKRGGFEKRLFLEKTYSKEDYMKRRFANQAEGKYFQDRLETEYFRGYVCYIELDNVEKPLIVNNGICIKDNNYKWFELYPDNGKYALTIMFDDNENLIEWYFDIAKSVGLENGIPYEDDLYLDMIITPEGKVIVIDEEELLEAEKKGVITHEDVDSAYKTLDYLKEKYAKDLDNLIKLTDEVKRKFTP